MADTKQKIKHLYARAGFGLKVNELEALATSTVESAVNRLFESSIKYTPLKFKTQSTTDLDKKTKNKLFRENVLKLNQLWMKKLSTTDAVLREKMTLFWHDHFACRVIQSAYSQRLNNTLRKHALGNFGKLVYEVAKEPAMLQFLNNKQNKKEQPNENFARELLELFTIGQGNYTEQDIKEAARAFTGWSFNADGEFIIRKKQHDNDSKTFFGETGNWDGLDIIKIILSDRRTAKYICGKLYQFFVNDRINKARVNKMAKVMVANSYDLKPVLRHIFTSDWFYDDENIGVKIKSPVELLVGLNRQFSIKYKNANSVVYLQRILGQLLFFPPSVAGWDQGKGWVDSTTLNYRLKIPSVLLGEGRIEWKENPNQMNDEAVTYSKNLEKKIKADPNWRKFKKSIKGINTNYTLARELLNVEPTANAKQVLNNLSKDLKHKVIEIVSLPEYQLV